MMVLLVGGAYQGKLQFASSRLRLSIGGFFEGGGDNEKPLEEYLAVNHLDKLIKKELENGQSPIDIQTRLLHSLKDKWVLCDDIFCGIVPLDKAQREWREVTGRCLCELAKCADVVIRMQCGVPMPIKGTIDII